MQKPILLTRSDIEPLLSLRDAIPAVESAFSDFSDGKAVLPPAVGFPVAEHKGEMHIKSGYMPTLDSVAIKVASSFRENPKMGLPAVMATILLHDAKTGALIGLMDGTYITAVRTGAVGAVAAKHLSKKDSSSAGLIGTGVQGRVQLRALLEVRDIKKAYAYSIDEKGRKDFVAEMSRELGIDIIGVGSCQEAAKADILVTSTPSHDPYFRPEWLHKGLHINAIGSDNPKKQELFGEVLQRADKIVADRLEQCRVAGEIHHGLKEDIIKESNVYAELGEITSGKKKGRESAGEITLFDSTGVAVQDIATAALVHRLAMEKKIGRQISLS